MIRGKFITLEGGEGAGKSTQVKALAEFLRTHGIEVLQTREVGGAPGAEEIRELWLSKIDGYWDPLCEILLVTAARRDHLVKTIFPAMERGAWVVSDRFMDSSRAYQAVGLGLGTETVEKLYEMIAPGFEPDMTLLLDLPVEASLARMKSRVGHDDRYQQKDTGFHQQLRETYLDMARRYANRFRVIDASGDKDNVTDQIARAVQEKFGL